MPVSTSLLADMVDFLSLRDGERRDIYTTVGAQSGKSVQVLEKDVWVRWVLDAFLALSVT